VESFGEFYSETLGQRYAMHFYRECVDGRADEQGEGGGGDDEGLFMGRKIEQRSGKRRNRSPQN
jgi:hypothetical protein